MTAFSSSPLPAVGAVASGATWSGPLQRVDTSVAVRAYPAAGTPRQALAVSGVDQSVEVPECGTVQEAVDTVLNEDLFRSVLIRERKRADRFDEVFALGTVTFSASTAPDVQAQVAAALYAATRHADIVGWLDQDAVLGVIFSDLEKPTEEVAAQIKARVETELAGRLSADAREQVDFQWYIHAGPGAQGADGLAETDPLLDDIRSTQERRSALDTFKRAFDFVCSLILLVLLSPLFLLLAVLVKLTSPGPVLFRQVRVGQLAKPFTMLKFRSMHTQADTALHQKFVTDFIKSSGQSKQAGEGRFFKIVNDPRITPIGHILRKTSLDELPQIWNVLRGEMSLVGPRPPLRYELEQYRSWHWRRVLEAKPGVTGLWQVAGRSRTTFDEMVRLDLRYVRTRSLWTDIRILLATPRAVVTGKGAC
jgi:lipopolysaccharide/colanic/teichoic acid biosynthesis glycosyltransferase